jgi:hypothetical protein
VFRNMSSPFQIGRLSAVRLDWPSVLQAVCICHVDITETTALSQADDELKLFKCFW